MSKHKWLTVAVILAGLVGSIMLLWPAWQSLSEPDKDALQAPDFGSTIRVESPRIMLPERAGDGARVYLDITNVGEQPVVLTEVRLAHAGRTGMQETKGPAWMPVANLPVDPGETLSLDPDGEFAVISNYDSYVVPGAMIDLTLVFGTSATITVPAQVFKAV